MRIEGKKTARLLLCVCGAPSVWPKLGIYYLLCSQPPRPGILTNNIQETAFWGFRMSRVSFSKTSYWKGGWCMNATHPEYGIWGWRQQRLLGDNKCKTRNEAENLHSQQIVMFFSLPFCFYFLVLHRFDFYVILFILFFLTFYFNILKY